MMYRPDPFFEAQSVGPTITFGHGPLRRQLAEFSTDIEVNIELDDIYGPNWNKKGIPVHPDRKAFLEHGNMSEATDEEAEVLALTPDLWSNPVRVKMGLPPLADPGEIAQKKFEEQLAKTDKAFDKVLSDLDRQIARRRAVPTGWLLAGGVGLVALAGGAFFVERRRRAAVRMNPRRRRNMALLAVGGTVALLLYGGKKTVEAAQAAVQHRPPSLPIMEVD